MRGRVAGLLLGMAALGCPKVPTAPVRRATFERTPNPCAGEVAARCLAKALDLLELRTDQPKRMDAMQLLIDACGAKYAPACAEQKKHLARPQRISGENPQYTAEARDKRVEGTVLLRCVIDAGGVPSRCQVVRSVPSMDEEVLRAVSTWRMNPATFDGIPVEIDYVIAVKLTLQASSP
ncbi:MAG TPA: energy transducer TonB [Myxococcaceae bacterium]|nr:energy transducer TonB [Myxococcaceae bacterium]